MTFDVFALLISDDDHTQADHMFTSKVDDTVTVADVLNAVHCENHRLCTAPTLASRFRNGAAYSIPCVRSIRAECRVLVDTVTDFDQSMPKTTKACKLADLLISSVYAY